MSRKDAIKYADGGLPLAAGRELFGTSRVFSRGENHATWRERRSIMYAAYMKAAENLWGEYRDTGLNPYSHERNVSRLSKPWILFVNIPTVYILAGIHYVLGGRQ